MFPKKMTVLGLMSGTSLDGLDLALCEFDRTADTYSFDILQSRTSSYSAEWKDRLNHVKNAKAEDYFKLNAAYGRYTADEVNLFLKTSSVKPHVIASHGHTVFHQPQLGFSTQLGCGATIAANTGFTTICDFRSLDVAHAGQGAPLVPIGDQLLFGKYGACLNIGGIANVSYSAQDNNRTAFDICEANMLLNYLAEKTGKSFDKDGEIARLGKINLDLLKSLNVQDYYIKSGAKSLGREWFENNILPLLDASALPIHDLLSTATEHVAQIIANTFAEKKIKNVLVTGGGAFNVFLMQRLRSKTTADIVIPDAQIINFKEALIFAFLGYLRLNEQINSLKSVTGAKKNSVGGAVYVV